MRSAGFDGVPLLPADTFDAIGTGHITDGHHVPERVLVLAPREHAIADGVVHVLTSGRVEDPLDADSSHALHDPRVLTSGDYLEATRIGGGGQGGNRKSEQDSESNGAHAQTVDHPVTFRGVIR
jgi:hypothetical protein